jgi:hypothetical protein
MHYILHSMIQQVKKPKTSSGLGVTGVLCKTFAGGSVQLGSYYSRWECKLAILHSISRLNTVESFSFGASSTFIFHGNFTGFHGILGDFASSLGILRDFWGF